MATIDDLASDAEQRQREIALAEQAYRSRLGGIRPTGACHYCGDEDLETPGALFCCNDCRDDFERQQKIRRNQGRA